MNTNVHEFTRIKSRTPCSSSFVLRSCASILCSFNPPPDDAIVVLGRVNIIENCSVVYRYFARIARIRSKNARQSLAKCQRQNLRRELCRDEDRMPVLAAMGWENDCGVRFLPLINDGAQR